MTGFAPSQDSGEPTPSPRPKRRRRTRPRQTRRRRRQRRRTKSFRCSSKARQAKVKKLEQEAQLIAAKIKTESVNQQVSAAGVDYDKEKLRMEKASTLNTIEQGEHQRSMQTRDQNAKEEQTAHGMMMTEKNAENTADQSGASEGPWT